MSPPSLPPLPLRKTMLLMTSMQLVPVTYCIKRLRAAASLFSRMRRGQEGVPLMPVARRCRQYRLLLLLLL